MSERGTRGSCAFRGTEPGRRGGRTGISGISTRAVMRRSHKRSAGQGAGGRASRPYRPRCGFNIHESFPPFYRPLSANIRRLNTHVIIITRHNRHKRLYSRAPGTILHRAFSFDALYTQMFVDLSTKCTRVHEHLQICYI